MTVLHIPTEKEYEIVYEKKNRYGIWYYTTAEKWLFAADCKKIFKKK